MSPLVVVAGALANKAGKGGEACVRASWIRGLAGLGCRVAFVEEIEPAACTGSDGAVADVRASVQREWFEAVAPDLGATEGYGLFCNSRSVSGPSTEEILDLLGDADLLVNISGNLSAPGFVDRCRRRAYVDIDPGFTQLWAANGDYGRQLAAHHVFFTIGQNIGSDRCRLPSGGVHWRHVRPPVVLADCPAPAQAPATVANPNRFTTVATWRGALGALDWEGSSCGSKVREFRRFASLPERVDAAFELALSIEPTDEADRRLLVDHGWTLTDPAVAAGTPAAFEDYVATSDAEFSVAQQMYVATRCGWFSDRSTRYLAHGRPVLVQETGVSDHLPTGKGLVTFASPAEAVAGAEEILSDYAEHARAARHIAEEYFASDRVLPGFLEDCLA